MLIGQPDMEKQRLDNAVHIPNMLSFITYQRWDAHVRGLDAWPKDQHPDNIPLLYYSFHMMVGLGTIFIGIMAFAAVWLWRGRLFQHELAVVDIDAQLSAAVSSRTPSAG